MHDRLMEWQRSALDVVHVDTVGLWPYLAGWEHSSTVLVHHNIKSDLANRRVTHEPSRWRAALLRDQAVKLCRLEARAVSRAAVNVLVSQPDAERFGAIAPQAVIEVVENVVDPQYWRPGASRAGSYGGDGLENHRYRVCSLRSCVRRCCEHPGMESVNRRATGHGP